LAFRADINLQTNNFEKTLEIVSFGLPERHVTMLREINAQVAFVEQTKPT